MSTSIRPIITWVNETPSTTGKTVKVLLMDPAFAQGVSHFAYIPAGMAPRKWDTIEAETVKLGDIETDYTDANGVVVALKVPRRQVSFFGAVALSDGEPLPETKWSDNRTKKNAPVTEDGDFF